MCGSGPRFYPWTQLQSSWKSSAFAGLDSAAASAAWAELGLWSLNLGSPWTAAPGGVSNPPPWQVFTWLCPIPRQFAPQLPFVATSKPLAALQLADSSWDPHVRWHLPVWRWRVTAPAPELSGFCFSSRRCFPPVALSSCGSSAVCSPNQPLFLAYLFSEVTRAAGSGRDVGARGIPANAGQLFLAASLRRSQQFPGTPFPCCKP